MLNENEMARNGETRRWQRRRVWNGGGTFLGNVNLKLPIYFQLISSMIWFWFPLRNAADTTLLSCPVPSSLLFNVLKVIRDIIGGWNLDNLQIRFNYTAHVLPFIAPKVRCRDPSGGFSSSSVHQQQRQKPRLKHQTNITWCGESISPIPACPV